MFNFKKVASVVSSAVMVSSTVALAAAATYPDPFVKNGVADVAVVYGGAAAQTDLVAAADIQSNLATELAAQTAESSGATSTVTGGDSVLLAKASNNVNLRDAVNDVFGSTVDDDDLSTLLADGTYLNDENTEFDYDQKILLGTWNVEFFADSEYNDKEPTVGINISSNQFVLNYTIDFKSNAESDVSSSDLVDLETTTLSILGRNYFISDADNSTTGKFTLLDSANTGSVNEGETNTMNIGDKSYDVSINFISTTEVKLEVNGELTNSLNEGESYRLSDGSYVGITDISARDVAGTVGNVEFSIGSGKLELPANGVEIELNDDTIEEIKSYIVRGSVSGGKETIDKIVLEWITDDDAFITPEQGISMPGFGAIKLSMGDFVRPAEEILVVENNGDRAMQIKAELKDGLITVPLLYANDSGEWLGIGSDSDELLVTSFNNTNVIVNETGKDEWLVASYNTTRDAESYILSFTFTTQDGINKTTARKRVNNDGVEEWEVVCKDLQPGDDCDVGSVTLSINDVTKVGAYKTVDLNGSTDVGFHTLYTKSGLAIAMPYATVNYSESGKGALNVTDTFVNGKSSGASAIDSAPAGASFDTFSLNFTEETKDDDIGAGTIFGVTLDDKSDGDSEVSKVAGGHKNFKEIENDDNTVTYVYSDLASKIRRIGDSSSQRTAEITYGGSESYAEVYITDISAQIVSDGTGAAATELGSIVVTDAEVSSVQSKNLIVVGGSCINSVAAELLGGALCGADFEEATGIGAGQYLIKTYTNPYTSSKIATLVAGYNAADTTAAGTVLRTGTVTTDVDAEITGP